MSFSREGWKSQKILAQVCRDCLFQRLPTPVMRRMTTSIIKEPPPLTKYDAPVRKVIQRREERKQLVNNYRHLKKHQQLASMTQADIDDLLAKLKPNPNDPTSVRPLTDAFAILADLKKNKFQQATFRPSDADTMIYIATELKWTKKATDLLQECVDQGIPVNVSSFEAVFNLLATQKRFHEPDMTYWLQQLPMPPTKSIVRSVVFSRVRLGQLNLAAHYLLQHHPTPDLLQLVTRHGDDEFELLDRALNIFGMDCIHEWRLNDARQIYIRKRKCGMSTGVLVKQLMYQCLYTGQVHTAQRLLSNTIATQDVTNVLGCSSQLIQWYLSKKDIRHAVAVWDQLESEGILLQKLDLEKLAIQAAKLKYHVDALRMYRRMVELYPIGDALYVHLFKCLVRCGDYKHVKEIQNKVESRLPYLKPDLARVLVKSFYLLIATTGDVKTFERIFEKSEALNLSLTHRGLTSLMACYFVRGDLQAAKAAFKKIATHTDGPDVVDFNLLMKMVVMEEKKADHAKIFEILRHMNLMNVEPDKTTLRTMLDFYKSESNMQKSLYKKLLEHPDALSRFDKVFLNNIAFGSLLNTLPVDQVIDIFHKNDRSLLFPTSSPQEEIQVNGVTFKMLIDAANSQRRYVHLAERLFQDMDARGMKPSRETYDVMIRNLARKGKITKARRFITKMERDTGEKANVITYTTLIDGFLYLDKPHLAKEIIRKDMAENNIPLDKMVREKLKKIDLRIRQLEQQ